MKLRQTLPLFNLLLFLSICSACFFLGCDQSGQNLSKNQTALADTPENRRSAAVRYLQVQPMEEMMNKMYESMIQAMPSEGRAEFKKALTESIDFKVLEKSSIESMVKNFTLSEIDALANFYGSKDGKSVMKKMPQYMADMMPMIQKEMMAGMAKKQEKLNN